MNFNFKKNRESKVVGQVAKISIASEYKTNGLLMTDCKQIHDYLEDINTTIYFRQPDYKDDLASAPEILSDCCFVFWNIFSPLRDMEENKKRIYRTYKNIAEIVGDQIIERNKIEVSQ